MSDQAERPNAAGRWHRWWQFGLRGLLFLVLLIAVGLLACREYLKPYWRQQQTVALVEQLGGSCQTTEVSQWWLRLAGSAQNVTQVNLADCDDPDAYVAAVAELPAIELLIVGGPAFTDEHARRLHKTRSLRGLILDCTSVSDEGFGFLREALRNTEIYASQRRAIASLRKVGVVGSGSIEPSPLRDAAGDDAFEIADGFVAREAFCDRDAAHLRMLKQAKIIRLSGAQISDAGLAGLRGLNQLDSLDLSATQITDAGLERLTSLNQVLYLRLGAKITDASIDRLKALSQLVWLEFVDSRVTSAGVADLQQALPNCSILGP